MMNRYRNRVADRMDNEEKPPLLPRIGEPPTFSAAASSASASNGDDVFEFDVVLDTDVASANDAKRQRNVKKDEFIDIMRKHAVTFKVKKTTPFVRVMNAYKGRYDDIQVNRFIVHHTGYSVAGAETAGELGLFEGAYVIACNVVENE